MMKEHLQGFASFISGLEGSFIFTKEKAFLLSLWSIKLLI